MPRKRNGNGRPKKKYFGIASAGVGINILEDHGWLDVFEQFEQGDDVSWGGALRQVGSNSGMGQLTQSAIKGLVLAGFKRNLGHIPLISGRKTVLSVF